MFSSEKERSFRPVSYAPFLVKRFKKSRLFVPQRATAACFKNEMSRVFLVTPPLWSNLVYNDTDQPCM